jgi:dTDP-4-amino-4,6-dideoxygalactose transaminase
VTRGLLVLPVKNLGAFGKQGWSRPTTAHRRLVHSLRAHGSRQRFVNTEIGATRSTRSGALLRVKLPHVARWNDERRRVAAEYTANLGGIAGVTPPSVARGCTHVFHQYTLRISDGRRDAVARALESAGIATQVYYPIPIHQLPVYAERKVSLPITEAAASEAGWAEAEAADERQYQ